MTAQFLISAFTRKDLPPPGLPEVAFVGRSNCGKSTLLNALTGVKGLARVSRHPGRTQCVNFFGAPLRSRPAASKKSGDDLLLVDLPGFGYAAVARTKKRAWGDLMDAYLQRPSLRGVLFLHDCRRDLTDSDAEFLNDIAAGIPVRVVLTKADKLSRSEKLASIEALKRQLAGIVPVSAVSAAKNDGLDTIWAEIRDMVTAKGV